MSNNVFMDKACEPKEKQVQEALQENAVVLQELDKHLDKQFEKTSREWKYYNSKSGWVRKTYVEKRNLFFLIVCHEYFNIGFVFGDKAVLSIQASALPVEMIEKVVNARKYAEGRGLLLEIHGSQDLQNIFQLIEIKIQN